MDAIIHQPAKADYPRIMDLWEASVRATHHFLTEADIQVIKPLISDQILDLLKLYCIDKYGVMAGIMGLSADKVEMLFIHPDMRGQGIGKQLFNYAVNGLQIKKVDVNEQNEQALGFYRHMGFVVTGRTETDALGKPYPILEMELV